MNVRVSLELKNYCIETAAKKEYRRLMDSCFSAQGAPEPDIEEKIMLLSEFMEHADFSMLRAGDERLSGSMESVVILSRDAGGSVKLEIGR